MQFATFKKLTRIEQSLFGLPFLLAAALLAISSTSGRDHVLLWLELIGSFLLARIAGMAFNQLIDRKSDALNPRTSARVLPSGQVSLFEARLIAWGSLGAFLFLAVSINPSVAKWAPLVALFLYSYSYMKRLHWSAHFFLGIIHGLGPLMACLVFTERFSLYSLCLAAIAGCVIAGSDILYAIQDEVFDKKYRLYSLPACFGGKRSLQIGAGLHGLALGVFFLLSYCLEGSLSLSFLLLFLLGLMFIYLHRRLWKQWKEKAFLQSVDQTLFMCNSAMSCCCLLLTLHRQ